MTRVIRRSSALDAASAPAATRLLAAAGAGALVGSYLLGSGPVELLLVLSVIPWLIGRIPRLGRSTRLGRIRRLGRTARVHRRDELIASITAEERMKLAREVHDIAGHGFAVIAMQAGVALLSFDDNPDQARESLDAVQLVSARALRELRSMLGSFRQLEQPARVVRPAGQPLEPAASDYELSQVRDLVDSVRVGGLAVELNLDDALCRPQPPELNPDVPRVVYRLVQESLTNVLRHARADTATVDVRVEASQLRVLVTDRGVGDSAAEFRAGSGITGMQARVADLGGALHSGPRADGGFEVDARLPYLAASS